MPFLDEEINHALLQIHLSTAPGPDGMSPCFYQKHWDTVVQDVCNGVRSVLFSGIMLQKINYTHVTLIPKNKDPTVMTHLRAISLCNVISKICSKVLTNRLKHVLPKIISHTQTAFVRGRLISDNSMIASEIAHLMHKKNSGWNGCMALNLGISKVYNRIEWTFLEQMMRKLGFVESWVHLIMMSVTTITYSFKLNGNPVGYIHPKRGIRQGDPLSPYLFVICAEGLSFESWERRGKIKRITICKGAPSVNHLFFADESFIFAQSSL